MATISFHAVVDSIFKLFPGNLQHILLNRFALFNYSLTNVHRLYFKDHRLQVTQIRGSRWNFFYQSNDQDNIQVATSLDRLYSEEAHHPVRSEKNLEFLFSKT